MIASLRPHGPGTTNAPYIAPRGELPCTTETTRQASIFGFSCVRIASITLPCIVFRIVVRVFRQIAVPHVVGWRRPRMIFALGFILRIWFAILLALAYAGRRRRRG